MPTYEYKCPECKDKKDIHHSVTDDREILCYWCNVRMTKGFGGGSAIHFKGSGFYETDYKGT